MTRIDDRLHDVRDIVDDAGRLVTAVAKPLEGELRAQDLVLFDRVAPIRTVIVAPTDSFAAAAIGLSR